MENLDNLKPIIIGITGHRQIRQQDIPQLKKAVKEELQAVILKCPNSPVMLLTSLAEGADQLCASVAVELNIGLIVALPMEVSEYKRDFQDAALLNFEKLLARSQHVLIVPKIEQYNGFPSRDYYYRQADIYIATHSHALLALWDGGAPKRGGCGTAETVDMVLNHSYAKRRCTCYEDGFVIHIKTPRDEISDDAGVTTYLGNRKVFNDSLEKLEELNKAGGDPDKVSIENGKKYHKNLLWLAILGTALTLAFLLYDEIMIKWMVIVLGAMLLVMSLVFKAASKSKCHDYYVEYRVFAECLRVQNHLSHIGSRIEIADFLDWTDRFDTPWIHKAMQTTTVTREIDTSEDINFDWIRDQQRYHEAAAVNTQKKIKRSNAILKTALIASISIYILALVYEYLIAGYMGAYEELIRIILKVLVGTASAASLFAANYYGKLSLKRVYEDHVRMASYYKTASVYLDNHGLSQHFLYELINEELSENSNWSSYEKDNEIDFAI